MAKKKLITVTGILSVVLLAIHVVPSVGLFLNTMPWSAFLDLSGWLFTICFAIHMALTLTNVWSDWRRTRNEATYPALKTVNTAQIVSGICICVLTIAHAPLGQMSFLAGTHMMAMAYLVVNILLFAALCLHLGIALPHAFISLGLITSDKTYRNVKVLTAVLFGVLFAFLTFSNIYLDVFMGMM